MNNSELNIGVLALQGAFVEHVNKLVQLGVNALEVRKPEQLAPLDGLIIPGGESTAMGLIAERWGLIEPLHAWVKAGKPVWGTCAGLIFLAERVEGQKAGGQALIGGLDVTVNRNHFGRQANSFQTVLQTSLPDDSSVPVPAIFIRAPLITAIGQGVESMAYLHTADGRKLVVAVRQKNILATAFHPELTTDSSWHQFFIELVRQFNNQVTV